MTFELKLDTESVEFVLTPEKVEKWTQGIEQILSSVHAVAEKRKISVFPNKLHPERFNFACPYCGDSSKHLRKKRANIWLTNMMFKCYNGDCGRYVPLDKFFSDFGITGILNPEDVTQIHKLKDSINRPKVYWEDLWNVKEVLLDREFLFSKLKLVEIKGSAIEEYLVKRSQYDFNKFGYEPKSGTLFVFNTDPSNSKILGLQMRNMQANSMNKYLTYKLSRLYEMFKLPITETVLEVDRISTLFGVLHIDFSKPITIFEGPLDSFLLPNSLGVCSLKDNIQLEIDVRWLLDHDSSTTRKTTDLLNRNEQVFLWKKIIHDLNLPKRDKWDYNDLINYCIENQKRFNPDEYFSNDKLDLIWT